MTFDDSREYSYSGELDSDGKACGYGIAVSDDTETLSGTFLNNKIHGIGKFLYFVEFPLYRR